MSTATKSLERPRGAAAGRRGARWPWLAAAAAVVLVSEASPVGDLANGVLFSAHMLQHLMLLLVAPALVILGMPAVRLPERARRAAAVLGWPAGVGAMWLWHVPTLCDAAVAMAGVRVLQATSLLACGVLFWWPILARDPGERLSPPVGIGYLFTACLACSALGMLITLTPIEVCRSFQAPLAPDAAWASLRARLGAARDRQIGGLLMWVPMCLVYVSAIMLELARWFTGRGAHAWEESR